MEKFLFFGRKTFDFFEWTCYSICNTEKAVTKTVRQTRFSESRRLVQDDSRGAIRPITSEPES